MLVAKFRVERFTKKVDAAIVVESGVEADAEPPPDAVTWLT